MASKKYIFVRVRRVDFEKMIKEKKVPMEQDLERMTGKPIKIKNTQLFKIAANSTWDLGTDFQRKIIGAVRIKKKDIKL